MNKKIITLFLLLSPVFVVGLPNPNATEIQSGAVSFQTLTKELQITASDGAHVQYFEGLNISAGETVRFIQPSSEATVINQIMTQVPTQIDGNLYGNGKVVLLNPSGIIFGEGSVVDVGRLHAIAGTDLALAANYGLSGPVENKGLIKAGEVMLAGTSVSNSGTILAESGLVVLAAGGSLTLLSENGDLSVSLSVDNPSPVGAVSDIAGQAVLQSGILQASQVNLSGNSIINEGTITGESITAEKFSSITAQGGSLITSTLNLAGGADSQNGASVDLASKGNKITSLLSSGFFDSMTVRSASSLTAGEKASEGKDKVNLLVQNLDLRVENSDLTLNYLATPLLSTSPNSLLLAAENNLVVGYDPGELTYARKILYGRNLSTVSTVSGELELGSTVSLNANSVSIDDLSPTLSSSVIKALSKDNPTFEGFDNKGGLVELSSMTSQQLELLFQYGLFTGYSYFLEAPSATVSFAQDIAASGGSSAVFGGSFAVIASAGTSVQSSSSSGSGDSNGGSSDGGDNSDGGESNEGEEGGDSDSDSSGGGKKGDKKSAQSVATRARALGAIPFAPITTPISSPAASTILQSALTPEIESRLGQYLDQ